MSKTLIVIYIFLFLPFLGLITSIISFKKPQVNKFCLRLTTFIPIFSSVLFSVISYNLFRKDREFSMPIFNWLSFHDNIITWSVKFNFMNCLIVSVLLLIFFIFNVLLQKNILKKQSCSRFTLCFNILIFLVYIALFSSNIILTFFMVECFLLAFFILLYPNFKENFSSKYLDILKKIVLMLFHVPFSFVGFFLENNVNKLALVLKSKKIFPQLNFNKKSNNIGDLIYQHVCYILAAIIVIIAWCIYLFFKGQNI